MGASLSAVVSITCDDATEADFPSLSRRDRVDEAAWRQSKRDQGRNRAQSGLTCFAADRKTEPRFSRRHRLPVRSGDGSENMRKIRLRRSIEKGALAPFPAT
jgi:hypothetical protein